MSGIKQEIVGGNERDLNKKNTYGHIIQKSKKIFTLIGLQVVVILIFLEGFVYIFNPLGISYFPEMAAYLDTLILEEPIGYRNQPGLNDEFFGVTVNINSLGMRDREVPKQHDREFRILILGDSLPFGVGVEYEDSLPYKLERILNLGKSKSVYYRTLNMGVISYNTEQELIQLKQLGLALNPRLAFLLYSDNDVEPKMRVLEKRKSWYARIGQRSYAISLLFMLANKMANSFSDPTSEQKMLEEYYKIRWRFVDESLTKINALLRSREIPFVLFTTEESGYIFNLLNGIANREGFSLITLNPWKDPRWIHENPVKYRNSYVDAHPNAAGNEILAVLISEALEQRGLLRSQ